VRMIEKPVVEESVTVFPAFYCEFGKNLTLENMVFINMGCSFSETGGITIGDDGLIGHGSIVTTLNYGMNPDRGADMTPTPVVIGAKDWFGAGATSGPGETLGDGAIVGAGPVVTKDVPATPSLRASPPRSSPL
jgi:acetyltransferase-like isoleucine patch superfamily enzyme